MITANKVSICLIVKRFSEHRAKARAFDLQSFAVQIFVEGGKDER